MKILISGTSRGIGKAIALKFLKEGHKVYGIDIRKSSIKDEHYSHIQKDIRDKDLPSIKDINIIIANAGVQEEKNAIDVNLNGTINFIEKYQNSGVLQSILFIASASARNGSEFPLYAASKGGLVTYMKNLAARLADRKITVNALSPGGVNTMSNNHIIKDEKKYSSVLNETLLHKWIEVEEIAEWVYFMTVVNKSMTGEDVLVDNGEILRNNFIW